jgi:hypothetical protein
MARKTKITFTVEPLEGKALPSGLSNMAAAAVSGWSPPQLQTNPDPQPQPVSPAASMDAISSNGWSPPQLQTNPDPSPGPVSPAATSRDGTSNGWSPPQLTTNPDPLPVPVNPGATSTAGTSSTATSPAPVQIAVTTNHSAYRHGHPVHIKLTVTNDSTSPVSLSPKTIAKGLTVSHGSKVVWQPKHAGHNLSVQVLQPGQSVVLTEVWNGRAGRPGLYTIQESVAGATGSATIRIR